MAARGSRDSNDLIPLHDPFETARLGFNRRQCWTTGNRCTVALHQSQPIGMPPWRREAAEQAIAQREAKVNERIRNSQLYSLASRHLLLQ